MDPETNLQLPSSYTYCEVTFGEVAVGKTATRIFSIKNPYQETVHYMVTRNTDTNPIYHVYDLNKYEGDAGPEEEFFVKIFYSPTIPDVKNLDYFKIMDGKVNLYKLCVKGTCIGPKIQCSTKYLEFYNIPNSQERKRILELKNDSKVPVIFQFDVNSDQQEDIFKVEPSRGTIEGLKYVFVTVTFWPPNDGLFSRQIACLFLYHEPILVNLLGISSSVEKFSMSEITLFSYPFPHQETVRYLGYFYDTTTVKTVQPPISLSLNFLDFGRVTEVVKYTCNTSTTSLTNHLETDVEVEWFDTSKLFRIQPLKLTIPAQRSALYECKFTPEVASNLSGVILHGQVAWKKPSKSTADETENERNVVTVPIPINIRLLGHSFPKNQSWIPVVSVVPETVILPLTLPEHFSYTTFMIKTEGHLPVSFKLIPPRKSNFAMKPMIGLVRDYQMIAVQLQSLSKEKASYIEKWNIELNGQEDRLMPLYVKGQTHLPSITIGVNNLIEFEASQPGSKNCTYAPLKNTSPCPIRFRFEFSEETLTVTPMEGELCPYEEIFLTVCFIADSEEGIKDYEIICIIETVLNNATMGAPLEIPLLIVTRSMYSELCALPKLFEAGELYVGATIRAEFYIYNFGESPVDFVMVSSNSEFRNPKIEPETGRCEPKEKILVTVKFTVTVDNARDKNLIVSYNARKSKSDGSCISMGALQLFTITYHCEQNPLTIHEIIEHNYGYLFSNQDLWRFFQIDLINAALNETVENEIQTVYIEVPECVVGDNEFVVVFVVKNLHGIEETLELRRVKLCDCELIENSNSSFTKRQLSYHCPHKNLIEMEMSHPVIHPMSSQLLTVRIRHSVPGENALCYNIHLHNQRTVKLIITITSVPAENLTLAVYKRDVTLDLGHVYIGIREPPVRAFWVYNNNSVTIPFKLDDLEITKMNNSAGYPVLRCLNTEGYVTPRSRKPILFKFSPIQVKTYRVQMPLMLGKKIVDFTVTGAGVLALHKYGLDSCTSFQNYDPKAEAYLFNSVISLSINRVFMDPILAGTSTQKLCFIKNITTNSSIKFTWKPVILDGLLKLEVTESEGILKAQESRQVIIKLSSLNEPCQLKVLLYCEFFNHSDLLAHHAAIKDMQKKLETRKDEFIITENGEMPIPADVPDIPEKLLQPPGKLYVAIPIQVKIIGIADRDTCFSINHQFRQRPLPTIETDIEEFTKEIMGRFAVPDRPLRGDSADISKDKQEACDVNIDVDMTKNVLQCLIADAVFSKYFEETVENIRRMPCPIYQSKRGNTGNTETMRQTISTCLTKPQKPLLADICNQAVLDCLQGIMHAYKQQ